MNEFSAADAFLVMLIGAGPVKAVVAFIGLTQDMSTAVKRRVALTVVGVVAAVGAALLIFGSLLQQMLHFSDAALEIAGGIILLLLAIHMVISQGEPARAPAEAPPRSPAMLAVFPLALPLTLNPVGIVALITYSSTTSVAQGLMLLAALGVVLVIDLAVYLLASRVRSMPPALIAVLEIVLGILLAALAVELILAGLTDAGIVTGSQR